MLREGIATTQANGEMRAGADAALVAAAMTVTIQGGLPLLATTGSSRYLRAALQILSEGLRPFPPGRRTSHRASR